MKKNSKKVSVGIGVIIALNLALTSCGNNKKQPEVHTVSHEEAAAAPTGGDLNAVSEKTTASFKQSESGEVYKGYLALKAALVNTDALAAQKEATAMLAALKTASAEEKATVAATAIASNTDINKQRESFEVLTAAIETLLKDAITSGEVYKQFCPMAFEGRGASWLSDSKEIRNPYFGDKMLKCGLVKETLK